MEIRLLCYTMLIAVFAPSLVGAGKSVPKRTPPYRIAVYYWPNYHVDPRNEAKLGKGWTEWELVKGGKPKFPGHDQPHVPLWGHRDESDPREMARSIDAMADHGITAILFDWYRYNDGSFLDGCLRRGFLQAPNRNRIHFALMWANHNFIDIFPRKSDNPTLWYPGAVTRQTFDRVTNEAVGDFFSQPRYWKIDGKPYFSIYELHTMIKGLGGLEHRVLAVGYFGRRIPRKSSEVYTEGLYVSFGKVTRGLGDLRFILGAHTWPLLRIACRMIMAGVAALHSRNSL